jgi:uncharacterized membrane protein
VEESAREDSNTCHTSIAQEEINKIKKESIKETESNQLPYLIFNVYNMISIDGNTNKRSLLRLTYHSSLSIIMICGTFFIVSLVGRWTCLRAIARYILTDIVSHCHPATTYSYSKLLGYNGHPLISSLLQMI